MHTLNMLIKSISGLDQIGLADLAAESIRRCDIERQKDMVGNILLAGCNTMFRGEGSPKL